MMTISSTGIGHLDMGAMSKASSKSKESGDGCDAFASLMNMGSTSAVNDTESFSQQDVKPVDTSKEIEREAEMASEDVYKNTTEPAKADGPDKTSDIPENKKTDSENQDLRMNKVDDEASAELEELQSKLEKVLEELQAMLKDLIGEIKNLKDGETVTDEQLQDMLAGMGINMQDLLGEAQLKNFILNMKGSKEVNILIDENLSNLLSKFTAQLEEILKSNGISNGEQLIDEIENLTKQLQALTQSNEEMKEGLQDAKVKNQFISESYLDATKNEPDAVTENVKLADNKLEISVSEDVNANQAYTGADSESANQKGFMDAKSNIMANLNQAIDNAMNTNGINDVSAFSQSVSQADVVRQIIDTIKLNISKETTSVEMQLNPEQLGKVHITVASKDGVMQAQIVAETEAAKNAIEGSIAALKEAFQNQELKVEAVEVMVATYEFFNQSDAGEEQNQNAQGKKSGSINLTEVTDEELTEDEIIETEIMRAKGNSVSYSI